MALKISSGSINSLRVEMVGESCVLSAVFDCGLMILAKREFNKLKYRVCCGMLSTVDEFFIFVCNGTLPVFLSIKVK